jgi:hypothetical protein
MLACINAPEVILASMEEDDDEEYVEMDEYSREEIE